MRIRTTKTKNGRLFYVIKTYYDSKGIEHSMTVEKLGNENDIRARYGRDPDEWAKEHVRHQELPLRIQDRLPLSPEDLPRTEAGSHLQSDLQAAFLQI